MRKSMKAIFTLLLVSIMLCTSVGFAAPGDLTIQQSGSIIEDLYNIKLAPCGDRLFFFGSYSGDVYCLNTENGVIDSVNVKGLTEVPQVEDGEATEIDESPDENLTFQYLLPDGDGLLLIYSTSVAESEQFDAPISTSFYLAKMQVENETMTCVEKKSFQSDVLLEVYDANSWAREITAAVKAGNTIVFTTYNDSYDNVMYSLNTETLEIKEIDVSSIGAFTAYNDHQLLIEHYDAGFTTVEYLLYDLADESSSVVYSSAIKDYETATATGFACSPEKDLVYLAQDNALYVVSGLDFENKTSICALPVGIYCMTGSLMSNGRYAVTAQGCIAVRNPVAEERPSGTLTIASTNSWLESITNSYYSFMNAHGELEVFLSSETGNVLESMMNRDSGVDVYILQANDASFDAVYTRGYMASIKSDTLGLQDMYPFIQNFCIQNGDLVCYPVYAYGNCVAVDTAALEKIGMTVDELPSNWQEFLALLPDLAKKLEDVEGYSLFGSWQTQDSIRYSLVDMILNQYYDQQVASGNTDQGYNSPDLLAALEAVIALDLNSMGVTAVSYDEDSQGGGMIEDSSSYQEAAVNFYFSYMPDGWYSATEKPLFLSVCKDAPSVLAETIYFAFINPFSENQQAAAEYIEALAAANPPQYLYAFTPKDNEPLRYSWYEENMASYQQMIDEYTANVENATRTEDRLFYEEQLKEWQSYMDDAILNDWMVKPAALESYQKMADQLNVQRYNPLYGSNSSEIYDLVFQMSMGTLSPSEFIKQVDRKVQMMILEGN